MPSNLQFGGDREPVSGELNKGSRPIPGWLMPPRDQCVIKPPRQIVRCTQFGTEVFNIPGTVSCSDPENHEHPGLIPAPEEEWYDRPGWTNQQL